MRQLRDATVLGAIAATILASCVHCRVVERASDCQLGARSLAPERNSPALLALTLASKQNLSDGLSGNELIQLCRQQWQDNIETVHCGQQIASFCDRVCRTAQARTSCSSPPDSEHVMRKCRADSLPSFHAAFPACATYQLCDSTILAAPGTCPGRSSAGH